MMIRSEHFHNLGLFSALVVLTLVFTMCEKSPIEASDTLEWNKKIAVAVVPPMP
ncbi:MAG: hypothetical protein V1681_10850 [Candidatus Neomarinimicrobiota bacterium]